MMRALRRLKWPILVCVIGIGLTIWLVMSLFASFAGPGISLLLPAEATFEITQTGKYTLWSQVEASFQGQLMTFPTGLPPGVTIKITKKADGSVVPVHSQWPTTHRDAPRGYIQVAIGSVTFEAPGSYQIATEGLQEKRALYLDRFDFKTVFLKAGFGSVGPFLFLAGLVWGIVVFISDRQT
jgi:hypothetical protein